MEKLKILLNHSGHPKERIITPQLKEELSQLGEVAEYITTAEGASHEAFLEAVADSDVMVTTWGSEGLKEADNGRTGRLRLHIHGAGSLRPVTTQSIIESGVRTTQGAGPIAKAVAHYTVGLILVGLRNSVGLYLANREGERPVWTYHDLDRLTVGVVSLSRVGRQVVELLQPFGAKVLAFDPTWSAEQVQALGAEAVSLDELIDRSDVVTLHAPVIEATKGMINAERISRMKPGALLVNTARGILVDQDALFERCYKGELAAYVDVTTPEPLPLDHPAWKCPHIFITPHIAGPTQEALQRIQEQIVDNVKSLLADEPLEGEVTPERFSAIA